MSVEKEQRRFGEYVDATAQNIGKLLEMQNMLLHAGAGVFAASETVTREKWRAYYESILANNAYPGTHAICFSEVIMPSELEEAGRIGIKSSWVVMDGHGIDVDFVLTHHLAIANVNEGRKDLTRRFSRPGLL